MLLFQIIISIVVLKSLHCETDIFDFIVVGGGTAGSIVAARLSELSCVNVILLEAGGDPPNISEIPVLGELMVNTEVDWNHTSVPQVHLNPTNKVFNLNHGKMLGGTGSLNGMIFFRGSKFDYNYWEQSGSKGWGWDGVLPYFMKIENDREIGVEKKYHGYQGPICVTNPGRDNPIVNAFIKSVKNSEHSYYDPNSDGINFGHSYAAINVCENKRQSTYQKYLKPVLRRKNLKVITHAVVEKIIFNDDKNAIAVIYSKNGIQNMVIAKKEIIISAGAINSAHLLMLSGIGPRSHLVKFKIPVISDLPVGQNLEDHVRVLFTFTKPHEDIYNNKTLKQFFGGNGPLVNFSYGSAFINTKSSIFKLYPDIQIYARGFSAPQKAGKEMKYSLRVLLLRPKSRGFIHLNSNNASIAPKIDPQYLKHEDDVKVLADGSKIAHNILKSMKVSEIGYIEMKLDVQNCEKQEKNSDKYWHCFVKNTASAGLHFSSTCKMGLKEDKESVVDNQLRVIGVNRLRVIDASIMPRIISSNIQAAVMMIAEKGSDLIKESIKKCN